MLQRFGSDPARSRDSIRSRLDVQRRSQVDDHKVVAGVQPSLEAAKASEGWPRLETFNMPLNSEYEPTRAPESASRSNCMKRPVA